MTQTEIGGFWFPGSYSFNGSGEELRRIWDSIINRFPGEGPVDRITERCIEAYRDMCYKPAIPAYMELFI